MHERAGLFLVVALLVAGSGTGGIGGGDTARDVQLPAAALGEPAAALPGMSLPLVFEENRGQLADAVRFHARAQGYAFYLTDTEAWFVLPGQGGGREGAAPAGFLGDPVLPVPDGGFEERVVMRFVGGQEAVAEPGVGLGSVSHHLRGGDEAAWRRDARHYEDVYLRDVWPGIDVRFYGTAEQVVRYDFIIGPGASPDVVRLGFDGVEPRLARDGTLMLGPLHQPAPFAYQDVGPVRQEVESAFVVAADATVSFEVGAYDARLPLVIDPPVVSYGSFLGGAADDDVMGLAVDAWGGAYIVGYTKSLDFPMEDAARGEHAGGEHDAYVAYFTPGGALGWSTFLGGNGTNFGLSIALGPDGAVFVAAYTDAPDFPVKGAYQAERPGPWSGTVTKLDPTGRNIIYSTYLGGSGVDTPRRIAVDASGNAVVVGRTTSLDYPVRGAAQPVYPGGILSGLVTKLNAAGDDLVHSTYLGGSGAEAATGLAVDASGGVYVSGQTDSNDFPVVQAYQAEKVGARDGFLTKFAASGAIVYSTFLGSAADDGAIHVAVDAAERAIVVGATGAADFPVKNAVQPGFGGALDGFVVMLEADGQDLVFSTFLGGTGADEAWGIAVGPAGDIHVSGVTASMGFPTQDAFQPGYGGGGDAFYTVLGPFGAGLSYSTFLGGSASDFARDLALTPGGEATLAGYTASDAFPVAAAYQGTRAGGVDGFVVRFGDHPLVALNAETYALYPSVQSAVDAGAPGERVLIVPGTYAEEVVLASTGITLCGADRPRLACGDDASASVLRGMAGTGLHVAADNVTLRGLSVLVGGDDPEGAAGVRVAVRSPAVRGLHLDGLIVRYDGAAVAGEDGFTGRVEDARIEGTRFEGFATGVRLRPYGAATGVVGNTFVLANTGIVTWSEDTWVEGNTFSLVHTALDVAAVAAEGQSVAGTVVRGHDFGDVLVPLRVRADATRIDARANDWGLYDHFLLPLLVDDQGTGNIVHQVPFVDADGLLEPPRVRVEGPGADARFFLGVQDALQDPATGAESVIFVPGATERADGLWKAARTPRIESIVVERAGVRIEGLPFAGALPVITAAGAEPAIEVIADDVVVTGLAVEGSGPLVVVDGVAGGMLLQNRFRTMDTPVEPAVAIRLVQTDAFVVRGNVVRGSMVHGSIGIDDHGSIDLVVRGNVVTHSATGIRLNATENASLHTNVIAMPTVSVQPNATTGIELVSGSGHALERNLVRSAQVGLMVAGTQGASSDTDTYQTSGTSVVLAADGSTSPASQPSGFSVNHARLLGLSHGLHLRQETTGVHVDATCNDWNAYQALLVQQRIRNDGALNTVEFVPYAAPDSSSGPWECLNPPRIELAGPENVARGAEATFTIEAQWSDRPILKREWTFGDGHVLEEDAPFAGEDVVHAYSSPGAFFVTLRVVDSEGVEGVAAHEVHVEQVPPVLAPLVDQSVESGAALALLVGATHAWGDPITLDVWPLPAGALFTDDGNGTGTFSWTPTPAQAGTYALTATATVDGADDMRSFNLTVVDVNLPPALESLGDERVHLGDTLQLMVSASDPNGDTLFLAAAPVPSGATFVDHGDGTAAFSWTPLESDLGTRGITFVASDGALETSASILVEVRPPNVAPVITAPSAVAVGEGALLGFELSASDPDGDAVTLSAHSIPLGAQFTDRGDGTAAFEWTPEFGQRGVYVLEFTGSDGVDEVSTAVQVTVNATNRPPVFEPVPARLADVGETVAFAVTASDPDDDPVLLWAIALPPGATFAPLAGGSGAFEWVPPAGAEGAHVARFAASDGEAVSELEIAVVVEAPGPLVPVLVLDKALTGVGEAVTFDARASHQEGRDIVRLTVHAGDGSSPRTASSPAAALFAHTYTTMGTYVVRLEVENTRGHTNTTTSLIVVGAVQLERTEEWYPSIQAAVDDAVVGDVVLLHPGLYRENVVLAGGDLELRSVVPHMARLAPVSGDAVVVTGGDARVVGLRIQPGMGTGVRVDASVEGDVEVEEVRFIGSASGAAGTGIAAAAENATLRVHGSSFRELATGVRLGGLAGGVVEENLFEYGGRAIVLLEGSNGFVVRENQVQRPGIVGIDARGAGHAVNGNEVLLGATGMRIAAGGATLAGNRVLENDVGLHLVPAAGGAPIALEGNRIEGNGVGLLAEADVAADVRNNAFTGNGIGAQGGVTVDARFNWWGHPGGPLLGNAVQGGVQSAPWCLQPDCPVLQEPSNPLP